MKRLKGALAAGMIVSLTATAHVAAQEAQGPDSAGLYRQHCRSCHGASGTPSARMLQLYPALKPLSDSSIAALTADSIVKVLVNGKGDKKPFGDKLTREEMAAVASYVLTLGRPAGP